MVDYRTICTILRGGAIAGTLDLLAFPRLDVVLIHLADFFVLSHVQVTKATDDEKSRKENESRIVTNAGARH